MIFSTGVLNFRKAKYTQFINLVDLLTGGLPSSTSPDADLAYSFFCQLVFRTVKKAVPH